MVATRITRAMSRRMLGCVLTANPTVVGPDVSDLLSIVVEHLGIHDLLNLRETSVALRGHTYVNLGLFNKAFRRAFLLFEDYVKLCLSRRALTHPLDIKVYSDDDVTYGPYQTTLKILDIDRFNTHKLFYDAWYGAVFISRHPSSYIANRNNVDRIQDFLNERIQLFVKVHFHLCSMEYDDDMNAEDFFEHVMWDDEVDEWYEEWRVHISILRNEVALIEAEMLEVMRAMM